ncbi:MAG: hypothetical protein L6R36_005300 [Xanthoria steineri]|nr:MAG: hypothetical protein L6R36_005300 [Xanthoria steineri]
MRLLKTRTLPLLDFVDLLRPEGTKYAILSHTWGTEEVTLEDLHKTESKQLQGHKKIERYCAQADHDGYDYLWIDTCCIDKKSSAELSEAINSMYNWYYWADVCYVYLSDFSLDTDRSFNGCRWFTRGWTLQELLASKTIRCYDQHWRYVGDKGDLAAPFSAVTGIEKVYIKHRGGVHTASVAARMSWASRRQTSRPEDEAYCLMGLFNVNMSLLYGEGSVKAFQRLQHKIIKTSEDESLFAWSAYDSLPLIGLFAPHPSFFRECGDIEPVEDPRIQRMPYSITNRGLSIEATYHAIPCQTIPIKGSGSRIFHRSCNDRGISECLLLPLKCARKTLPTELLTDSPHALRKLITIILMGVPGHEDNVFARCLPTEMMVYEKYFQPKRKLCHRNIFIQLPVVRADLSEAVLDSRYYNGNPPY